MSEFKSLLWHLAALWTPPSALPSLCLSFPIYKRRIQYERELHLKKLYTGYYESFRKMVRHPLIYLKFMSSLCCPNPIHHDSIIKLFCYETVPLNHLVRDFLHLHVDKTLISSSSCVFPCAHGLVFYSLIHVCIFLLILEHRSHILYISVSPQCVAMWIGYEAPHTCFWVAYRSPLMIFTSHEV